MAQLAFYKGKGNLIDGLIRWWTRSKYSHVELVIGDIWYSTSPRDLQVRRKRIIPKEGHWDFVEVEIDEIYATDFFFMTVGARYDWTGIFLTQFIPLNIHCSAKYFCSEWCARAMRLEKAHRYSPEKLYRKVTNAS